MLAPGFLEPEVREADPERLRDVASFERSGLHSEGIEYVLVNGVLSIDAGSFSGRRAGRALRGPGFEE